jgi:L-fuculose-phosphate aldolase
MYESEKRELASFCRLLYGRGLTAGSGGNISLRVSPEHILLTPSGRNKGMVQAADILVLDLSGGTAEGSGKASREYPMHRAAYLARRDVRAVVHSHPAFATAFALAGKNLPENCLIETAMILHGTCLAEYAAPGTERLAGKTARCLAECDAVLLKNHGAVTVGKNLEDAFNKMESLENAAKTILLSRILGGPELIPQKEPEEEKTR